MTGRQPSPVPLTVYALCKPGRGRRTGGAGSKKAHHQPRSCGKQTRLRMRQEASDQLLPEPRRRRPGATHEAPTPAVARSCRRTATRSAQPTACRAGPSLGAHLQPGVAISLRMGLTGSQAPVGGGRTPSPGLLGRSPARRLDHFENSVEGSALDEHDATATLEGRYPDHQFPSE